MIRRIKPRSKPRPGRLKGAEMTELRELVYERDGGKCVRCGRPVWDELPDWHDSKFHLMHKGGKRNHGDSPENTECGCGFCHRAQHRGGIKVVPSKR